MIRILELATPFDLAPLSDCVEVLDRLRRPVNVDERRSRLGDVPYYGANGQVGWIDEWIFDEDLVLVAEDGGFFYDPYRPISYRISGKAWVNNHAHVLRPLANVDVDWLNFAIAFQDVTHLVKGATLKKLNQQDLQQIRIPLPPIAEQRRIASRIKACVERVEEVEQLSATTLDEAERLPQAFRFDLWNRCCASYPLVELRSLVASSKNGLYKPREFHGSGSLLLRLFNINGASFDTSRLDRVTVTPKEAVDYSIVNGDLIVSRVNSRELVGKSTVVQGLAEPAVFEAMLIRLRLDSRKAQPSFLAWLMNSPQFLHDLRSRAKHAIGQSSINQQDLLSSRLPMPPIAAQEDIAASYATLGELGSALHSECSLRSQAARRLRPSILAKAFAGEL